MADRTSRLGVRRKEKTAESKVNDERDKDKVKEKAVKKPEPSKADEKKSNGETGGATGAEAKTSEGAEEFQPVELPPFEIVTG